jgi:hypothetical protein
MNLREEQKKYRGIIESAKKILVGKRKKFKRINGVRVEVLRTYKVIPVGHANRHTTRSSRVLFMQDFKRLHPIPMNVDVWKTGPGHGSTRAERKKLREQAKTSTLHT